MNTRSQSEIVISNLRYTFKWQLTLLIWLSKVRSLSKMMPDLFTVWREMNDKYEQVFLSLTFLDKYFCLVSAQF